MARDVGFFMEKRDQEDGGSADVDISREAASMQALAARMGEAEFASRLKLEASMRALRGKGQGKGLFAFQHRINLYGLVRLSLKAALLWNRARRNYLDIRVERHEARLPRLPAAFDGFRILQLSDLHADLDPDFPDAVARVVGGLEYDAVVVTGDFRTCTFSDPTGAVEASGRIFECLRPPCHATLGNHDALRKVPGLESRGVRFLLNEHACLRRDGAELYLVGIDDPNFYKCHNFERALRGVPEGACKVLLSHSPQTYREAARRGFDLLLAGHTHGGQICLPGGMVVIHDGSSPRRVLSGAWREGALVGYTSRGTGATGLPARLNCPPEVTVHTLRKG